MSVTQMIKVYDLIKKLNGRVDMLEEKVEDLAQMARIKHTKGGARVPPIARPDTLVAADLGSDPKGT